MQNELAIEVNSLSKTYRDGFLGFRRHEALKNVSFQVKPGEVFGLLGPNGAGKTTFLKILLGVIRKTSGNATMLGFPAGSRAGRAEVGYLPEQLRMPAHLTGNTALEFYGNLANVPKRQIREKGDDLLKLVGIADRAKDRVKKYSKGMLQRLGLAQALLNEPKLLVLDEPTDGLDPRARAEMRGVIQKLKEQGVTIFLNSHILQEVEMICEKVVILDRGELKYSGSVDEIGDFVRTAAGGSTAKIHCAFDVIGNLQQIKELFSSDNPSGLPGAKIVEEGKQVELSLHLDDTGEIDKVVDALRERSISVVGLRRERVSLEDAFLQLLEKPDSAT